MTSDQIIVVAILAAALALFLWERWRYDLVAMGVLVAVGLAGLVPGEALFAGFGHPATITVAAVLVMSRGFANSGAVDLLARPIALATRSDALHVGTLSALGAGLSAFMNNVAALALLMPVAMQSALRAGRSPSLLLMPLAFAAVLGGIITLIGTPPNIILSGYRREVQGSPFHLWDFVWVGLPVAAIGVAFLALVGWRMLGPAAQRTADTGLAIVRDYLAELRIGADSKAAGKRLDEVEALISDIDVLLLGVVREDRRLPADRRWLVLRAGDVLLVEAAPDEIDRLLAALGATLQTPDEDVAPDGPALGEPGAEPVARRPDGEESVAEAVVHPRSPIVGSRAADLQLTGRFELNLLAVSRQGRPNRGRLRHFRIEAGDVLLLQGEAERLSQAIKELGCLPLAGRAQALGLRGRRGWGLALFGVPVALAASGLVPLPTALVAGALAMVITGLVPLRDLYTAVDWPVIVLLGGMMPLGTAFESTGTTVLVAEQIASFAGDLPPFVIVAVVIFVTMLLSDLLNNAATAVMMGPIAVAIAGALEASPDVYLMAVAIGASCAFLTPVGHQNYTLVMGPGGYRFSDYWRLGLPLEILVVAIATPLILLVWGSPAGGG